MAFFVRRDVGRIYVIRMNLPDDCVIHKIGMTNSDRAVDRMMEILRSWFTSFRFVPYSELILDMATSFPKQLETHIHKTLAHKQFIPNMKVDGGTEMFIDIDEFRVLHYLKTFNDDLALKLNMSDVDYTNFGRYLSP